MLHYKPGLEPGAAWTAIQLKTKDFEPSTFKLQLYNSLGEFWKAKPFPSEFWIDPGLSERVLVAFGRLAKSKFDLRGGWK